MRPPSPALEEEPERFDFFQAVRLIEGRAARARTITPVGEGSDGAREAVRFKANLSDAFPNSDLAAYDPAPDPGGRAELTVNFMSLAGAFGPLPTPITERIKDRRRLRDREAEAPAAFLDVFNHRLISLMMRIKRSYRLALQFGGPDDADQAAPLKALLGLELPGFWPSPDDPLAYKTDRGFLHLAGLLNQRPISLHAVERAVAYHLGATARSAPFQGSWLSLSRNQIMRLGRNGRNNRLGAGAILGSRVWSQATGVKLLLGPLSLSAFAGLLPTGEAHPGLRRLLGYMLGGQYIVYLELDLATRDLDRWIRPQPDRPKPRLGLGGDALKLGWTSWLLSSSRPRGAPFESRITLNLGEVA